MEENLWFKQGLPFKCTECGKCCTGPTGYVWVSEDEMLEIATHLGLSFDDFTKKYIRQVGERFSLVERKSGSDYECVFLRGKRCTIYEARPKQCKTFPWWPQNLESQESWKEVAKECEGINNDAPLIPLKSILNCLSTYEAE